MVCVQQSILVLLNKKKTTVYKHLCSFKLKIEQYFNTVICFYKNYIYYLLF